MTLLTANRLGKSYGGHVCFQDASFVIPAGGRIGLIGANGSGKTSLLRALAGDEECEGGLARRRGLEIARLEQSPVFPPGSTPRGLMAEAIRPWRELDAGIDALRGEVAAAPAAEREAVLRRLAQLEARREAGGGESAARRAETILRGVGLRPDQFDRDIGVLSGGERCRAALARLLVGEPDLWLLDEPTNHLDLAGIAFLERFLKNSAAAAVVVSHDRRFLDRMVESVWELDGGRFYCYPGNYSQSRRIREERRQSEWREFMKRREFLRREEIFINKWRAGTRARQAQSHMKRLARLETLKAPRDQSRLAALDLRLGRRLGDLVLETYGLTIGFPGKRLLADMAFQLAPGEILGVVGPNGAGKTTLFETLLGRLPPLAGAFRWGPTVEAGTLGQHDVFPDEERTPLEHLQDAGLGADDQDRRDKLGAMLFSGEDAMKPIRVLSGGEKKRLMLVRLLLQGHNALLLDEPTNHLDIQSAEAATLALSAWPGSVMAISHDRYFLDEVADRVLWIEDGAWRITQGGFSEAEAGRDRFQRGPEAARRREARRAPAKAKSLAGAKPGLAGGNPFAGWSAAKLERRIIANEERLAAIHAAFADPAASRNGNRMRQLQNELAGLEGEQAGLEAEYAKRG
ncbi:MAG: ABC-F family ATP-binding cassette domain-containing protein [Planctomycetota bacterium]|jgi:ATP-binding cassette subfamily F protein 3|nr:ABC-F family ATP-binding cassette domain-containing protein [Planctomycetota bacterium]